MQTDAWLRAATQQLSTAGIDSARLDCLILLEDASGHDRAWLLAHPEYGLDDDLLSSLGASVKRRAAHEPLAYIRSRTEFYGRQFYVDKRVLEARPESETIIELLKSLPLPDKPVIVDVGTGSGALAITAKLELKDKDTTITVYAADIDPDCLEVARQNAMNLQADVILLEADLLSQEAGSANLKGAALQQADIVLANLPYVPESYTINQAATHEPKLAIFGGPDGLDLYRRMVAQINSFESKPSYILAESLPSQHVDLTKIMSAAGYVQAQEQDFIQVFHLSS